MRAFIDKMLAQIKETFGRMDRKIKRGLFTLSFLIIIFATIAVILLTQTRYEPLHNFDTLAQAEQAYVRLQSIGINARREGTRILVPSADREIAFAEMRDAIGSPRFDTSLMDAATGFGTTDVHARQMYARQLGDDIRVQIMQSPRISNALVIIQPGESSPFYTVGNLRPPQASVMLTLTDSGQLSQHEAQTIADLVMAAVHGISYENITIADTNLNTYRVGGGIEEFETVINSRDEMERMLELRTRASVEQVLSRVFLRDNVEVLVSVRLNFDRVREDIVEFSPPIAGEQQGLLRSSHEAWEISRRGLEAAGIPGTDSNNMGMGEYPWGELGDDELYRSSVLAHNYELNQVLRTIEYAEGRIESLTVSVLVNSKVHEEDMSQEIINLIAMGVDIPRENVNVESLPFAVDTSLAEHFAAWEEIETAMRRQELARVSIIAVVVLVIGILFFILGKKIVDAVKPPIPAFAQGGEIDYMADKDLETLEDARLAAELEAQRLIEINLQAKQRELESIEGFIEKDPAAVAHLLRNWLSDD